MAIEQFIDNEVKGNDVVLFMKGTPQFPMCGFSGQVVQILDYLGVPYKGLNVLENDDLRNGIKTYSNWPTIPQLYVKGEFVGGCDIIREMFQAGELQSLMKEKGLPVKDSAPPSRDPSRARHWLPGPSLTVGDLDRAGACWPLFGLLSTQPEACASIRLRRLSVLRRCWSPSSASLAQSRMPLLDRAADGEARLSARRNGGVAAAARLQRSRCITR